MSCTCISPQINTKVEGKGLLHIAIIEGYTPIVKVLLGYNPNLELEVSLREAVEFVHHLLALSHRMEKVRCLFTSLHSGEYHRMNVRDLNIAHNLYS